MEITGCFLLLVITFFYTNQVKAQGRGSVRLFNNGNTSPNNRAGIVEVYYNNQWGTICRSSDIRNNYFTATVVCRQLGYSKGAYERNGSLYGSTTSQPVIYGVLCLNRLYRVILQCISYHVNPTCSSTDFLAVRCSSTRIWNDPHSGMLRLQDGPYAGMGRVEVYCNGQWGAICHDSGFDDNTANTVCTQLGYNNGVITSATAYSGTIWLSQISCSDTYFCLSDCVGGRCSTSRVTCSDDNVANVTCNYIGHEGNGGFIRCDSNSSSSSGLSAGAIAGIVIGSFVEFACCVLLFIVLPICICSCLIKKGIGAAASSGGRRFNYSNF